MRKDINQAFFRRSTLQVARSLLGMKLTTVVGSKKTSGMIVEVEAYEGATDEASHSFRGRTKRNDVMFWEGGFCYVYLIYGMYHCVNVVTGKPGIGNAVLIRALQPIEGEEIMRRRRNVPSQPGNAPLYSLSSGPGKLCKALAINRNMSGEHLVRSKKITLSRFRKFPRKMVSVSKRIGISKSADLEWRLYLKGNPWVSGHRGQLTRGRKRKLR